MRGILALGFVLAVFVALSSAVCKHGSPTFDPISRKAGCQYEGTFHKMGSEWISDCMQCSCRKGGMECCLNSPRPVDYDKVNCKKTFNQDSCKYTVTRKDNPSETCEVHSWVL